MKWLGRPSQPRWMRNRDGILMREDGVSCVERRRQCSKCGETEAGSGNILCSQCRTRIEAACG